LIEASRPEDQGPARSCAPRLIGTHARHTLVLPTALDT
jgi:hypothetical protein